MERQVRILVADDRPTTRRGLIALLTLLPSVEVVGEAADGRESVDLVRESRPDVVLMDMQMPVMDGLEATRRIKEQWPEIKVIALTIHAEYRSDALAAGADAFLVKDGAPDVLARAILNQVPRLEGQPAPDLTTVTQTSSSHDERNSYTSDRVKGGRG